MTVNTRPFGTTKYGEAVTAYELVNATGPGPSSSTTAPLCSPWWCRTPPARRWTSSSATTPWLSTRETAATSAPPSAGSGTA